MIQVRPQNRSRIEARQPPRSVKQLLIDLSHHQRNSLDKSLDNSAMQQLISQFRNIIQFSDCNNDYLKLLNMSVTNLASVKLRKPKRSGGKGILIRTL